MQKRESAESHLRLERTGFSVTHSVAVKYQSPLLTPTAHIMFLCPSISNCLIHLHGHEPAALPTRLPHLLLTAPVGTAIPDEAGQEPDDCGQAYSDEQRVLEGVQHWAEDKEWKH